MDNKWTAIERLKTYLHETEALIEALKELPDELVAHRINGSPGAWPSVHITVLDYDGFKQARRALRGHVRPRDRYGMEEDGRNVHVYKWLGEGFRDVFISIDPPIEGGRCRRVIVGEKTVPIYSIVCGGEDDRDDAADV